MKANSEAVSTNQNAPDDDTCKRCNGSGYEPVDAPDGYHPWSEYACGDCHGGGKAIGWDSYWHDYDERFRVR